MFPILVSNGKPVACPAAMDNAIALVYAGGNTHARTFLLGLQAQYSVTVSAVKTVTMYTVPSGDGLLDALTMAVGTGDDKKLKLTAFYYVNRTIGLYNAAEEVTFVAGTVPLNTWAVFRASIGSTGTVTLTPGATNYTTGYADEAAAIVGLPATPTNETSLGYFTVLTKSGLVWIAGTDSLQGGATGNVSDDTNYYAATALTLTQIAYPIRWDFGLGPYINPVPGILHTDAEVAFVAKLAASGTGGVTGEIVAWVATP